MQTTSVSQWVESFLDQVQELSRRDSLFYLDFKPDKVEAGKAILTLPRDEQVQIVLDAIPRQVELINGPHAGSTMLSALITALLRKKLPFTLEHFEFLVRTIADIERTGYWECVSPGSIMRALEEYVETHGLPASLREALEHLRANLRDHTYYAEPRKLSDRVEKVLKQAEPSKTGDVVAVEASPATSASEPQAGQLIEAFLDEVKQSKVPSIRIRASDFPAGRTILELPAGHQIPLLLEAVARQVKAGGGYELRALIAALLNQKLPLTLEHLQLLLALPEHLSPESYLGMLSADGVVGAAQVYIDAHGLPESLRKLLYHLLHKFPDYNLAGPTREIVSRLKPRLKPDAASELTTGEAWTGHLSAALAGMDNPTRQRWQALLAHCSTAASSKPSKKWLQQAGPLVKAIGAEAFAAGVMAILAQIGKPGVPPKTWIMGHAFDGDPTVVHDTHSDLLRGLVWCTSLVPEETLIAALGDAADVCFKKIPQVGPRAPKIGNACLVALSSISSVPAVAQLSRLKTRAKHVSIRKQLGKAMEVAAGKTGMSAVDLEEVAVPTCGLTAVGEYRKQLGDVAVFLRVTESLDAELSCLKSDGKTQHSVPASVKAAFPDEVKDIKRIEKEIAKLLPAQRDRIERLFAQPRSWSLVDFRARFLDHPLVGAIARRLIWRFGSSTREDMKESVSGFFHDGKFVNEHNQALAELKDSTRVSLWHPIDGGLEEVKAWRDWLETHAVRQPFKQAHREIYILTDAERQTVGYSNRFAAHLLKQHQFGALCQQRGWRYSLQGEWDSANTPSLALPQWDLRAEFWVQPIQVDRPGPGRSDVSHALIYLYLATDQVRFYRLESNIPLPPADVPPLAFSEVMRDVDLFVGVASVGNDPNWIDGGVIGRYRDYWEHFSFGELFPSAETRKEVLQRILPGLKIADRCSFTDRFLTVRGNLRSYKIHLGSGNILMTPNDQYLCIVPKMGAAAPGPGKIYLPFEGDSVLSVILSKAFLLADDSKIKDPNISRQITLAR